MVCSCVLQVLSVAQVQPIGALPRHPGRAETQAGGSQEWEVLRGRNLYRGLPRSESLVFKSKWEYSARQVICSY